MTLITKKICWLFLNLSHAVYGIIQAPLLPGSHTLGTTTLQVTDSSTSRSLMLSLFYPASAKNSSYTFAPSFPSATALYLAESYSLPSAILQELASRSYNSAPILLSHNNSFDFPILLFSPGYGNTRLAYTVIAENIASLGYFVITIDHPFDVEFIEYSNGTIATWEDEDFDNYTAGIPYVNARVKDMQFVLNSFSDPLFTAQIPGIENSSSHSYGYGKLNEIFQTKTIGTFGHSLGGAAAFQAMHDDSRFSYGINLDGAIEGNVVQSGLNKPFMIMANQNHTRTEERDPTWYEFWANSVKLGGWKRDVRVNATQHGSYTDLAVWATVLGLEGFEDLLGTINGVRILEIETEFVGEFFGKWLKGKRGKVLDGPSKEWPEVTFDF
ncbi:putative paf acetylhydrolase family protein [Botrytis fragariae]|uniref:1-alkyl-2-acetylglycerophosphocholine esterase n=1 Tax=Botrytis fragariae TaxID=1964551 RepID=A0A8H6ANJ9_9HELO|nr:putative paf acetylhydrolase family protein [Botrytis fragariae]KAF5870490.1 putative paf acetylhydrolase family protein [Botrytis fragariae]